MILCDYIKKITSTLSKVYHGNELVMTTDKSYLKRIPITFISKVTMFLGNGFTDIQYCVNYVDGGTNTWTNIPTEVGSRGVYQDGELLYTESRNTPGSGTGLHFDYVSLVAAQGHEDLTFSIRARYINNRTTSSSSALDVDDFRFVIPTELSSGINKLHVLGNINSLLTYTGWSDIESLANYGQWTFRSLFAKPTTVDSMSLPDYYSGVTNIDLENILLPNKTLSYGCYSYMFYGSFHITVIPANLFPSDIVLAGRDFQRMFAFFCPGYRTDDIGNRNYLKTPLIISRKAIPEGCTPQYHSFDGMFYNKSLSSGQRAGDFNLIKFEQGFRLPATMGEGSCYSMFENCNMLSTDDIPENLLPATTATSSCYGSMFKNFKYLDPEILANVWGYDSDIVTAIVSKETRLKLPATMINGYQGMFAGSSISNVIKFPKGATVSSNGLYEMYKGNTSISSANLSFKTDQYLRNLACASMFENCTGLNNVTINLMGGNLVSRAFQSAFSGCTNLRTANLNGVKNIDYVSCCANMFSGCSNLNSVYTDLEEWPSVNSDATTNWLVNVSRNGVLRTLKGITIPAGTSGLPTTWSHSYPV